MSGEATNRDGDGPELVPQRRGALLPSPGQSALLTITFNHPLTQWALGALYEYCGHRSLHDLGTRRDPVTCWVLPSGVRQKNEAKVEADVGLVDVVLSTTVKTNLVGKKMIAWHAFDNCPTSRSSKE